MNNLLDHTRDFLGFVMEGIKKNSHHENEFDQIEKYVSIQSNCALTTKIINVPALIKLDDNKIILVDRNEVNEQINKGFTFEKWAKPAKENIFTLEGIEAAFDRLK